MGCLRPCPSRLRRVLPSSPTPRSDPGLICVAESLSQQPGRGNRSVAGASCSRPFPERPAPSAGYLISMAECQQAGRPVGQDSRDGYPPKFKCPKIILASAKKNSLNEALTVGIPPSSIPTLSMTQSVRHPQGRCADHSTASPVSGLRSVRTVPRADLAGEHSRRLSLFRYLACRGFRHCAPPRNFACFAGARLTFQPHLPACNQKSRIKNPKSRIPPLPVLFQLSALLPRPPPANQWQIISNHKPQPQPLNIEY